MQISTKSCKLRHFIDYLVYFLFKKFVHHIFTCFECILSFMNLIFLHDLICGEGAFSFRVVVYMTENSSSKEVC